MKAIYGQHTEKGLRYENQDAVAAYAGEKASFFAVADGAGGLSSGRQASSMTVRAVMSEFSSAPDTSPESLMCHISEKYRQMNDYLNLYQSEKGIRMATTLSMLYLLEDKYIVSNVGDTLTLLFRNGSCQLASQVHNLAWVSYLSGDIDYKDIRKHEGSHILTRALGGHESIKPYIASGVLEAGDLFIITTDGVYNHLENMTMWDLFERLNPQSGDQMNAYCRGVVSMALKNGSTDNCSLVAVKIVD